MCAGRQSCKLSCQSANLIEKSTSEEVLFMVGVRRFELPASWSRTKRSTKLSHTPIHNVKIIAQRGSFVKNFFEKVVLFTLN